MCQSGQERCGLQSSSGGAGRIQLRVAVGLRAQGGGGEEFLGPGQILALVKESMEETSPVVAFRVTFFYIVVNICQYFLNLRLSSLSKRVLIFSVLYVTHMFYISMILLLTS